MDLKKKGGVTGIHEHVRSFLVLPERISKTKEDRKLPEELGRFLIEKGYIKKIGIFNGSWGFSYNSDSKKISIADREISKEDYDYYIFRLGQDSSGEHLYPKHGDETDQYRFLHETSHAYQTYLIDKESQENNLGPLSWYNKAVEGSNDSTFSLLFQLCYKIRETNENRGLSTWGNVPDYESIDGDANRIAMKALEDANELVTMSLWHPEYLKTFLNYVSLQIEGYDEESLVQDRLVKVSSKTQQTLKDIIDLYVIEMKNNMESK